MGCVSPTLEKESVQKLLKKYENSLILLISPSSHFQWKSGFSGPSCLGPTYMSGAPQVAEQGTDTDWAHDNQDLGLSFTLWCSFCSRAQHLPAKWVNLLLACGCLNGNLCRGSGWGTVWIILPWQPWISFIHRHLHPSFLAFSQTESSKITFFSIAGWNRSRNLLLSPW